MGFFARSVLIQGLIEGPVRLRVEQVDRGTYYTMIDFEIGGKTLEMKGDMVSKWGDHAPVPPPFVTGDAASISAHPIGDGVFKVNSMDVADRAFRYCPLGAVNGFLLGFFFAVFALLVLICRL